MGIMARPGTYLFLALICLIGLVERVAAALHGNGLGGSGWAWVSAAVMLAGIGVCSRSYVLARRARESRSAEVATVTA
jgi:hypothetical protein